MCYERHALDSAFFLHGTGDFIGDYVSFPSVSTRSSPLGHGTCQLGMKSSLVVEGCGCALLGVITMTTTLNVIHEKVFEKCSEYSR